jgi:hypothetical protein
MVLFRPRLLLPLLLSLLLCAAPLRAEVIESLKARYQTLGAGSFNPERGRQLWLNKAPHSGSGESRACTDCHGADLSQPGRHLRTRKKIAPLSPAIEATRFRSTKKVEKWFKRNCKWTWGRPCSPQEKGDILTFIQTQGWRR